MNTVLALLLGRVLATTLIKSHKSKVRFSVPHKLFNVAATLVKYRGAAIWPD